MSRCFRMEVKVKEYKPEKFQEIYNSLIDQWDFEPMDKPDEGTTPPQEIVLSGDGNLGFGMTEKEFAIGLAQIVWRANCGFCHIEVESTYLEALPSEQNRFSREDYKEWLINEHLHDFTDQQDQNEGS